MPPDRILAKVGVEGSNPFARSNFFSEIKHLEGTRRVQSAYIGRLATGCKRFVSSRIWSVPSALRRRMGREAPEPNRSRERPGKPHTEQCNAAAALRLASGACHESKSCCRGLGRPRTTSRPERRARTGRMHRAVVCAEMRQTAIRPRGRHRGPPPSDRATNRPADCDAIAEASRTGTAVRASLGWCWVCAESAAELRSMRATNSGARVDACGSAAAAVTEGQL